MTSNRTTAPGLRNTTLAHARNRSRALLAVLALAFASLAASCGSEPDPASKPGAAGATAEASQSPGATAGTAGTPAPAAGEAVPSGELTAYAGRVQLLPGMGAGYLKIRNDSSQEQRLTNAQASIASSVTIHETLIEEGVVRMKPRDEGFVIAVGEELVLEPGGKHLMLQGVDASGNPQTVTFTLTFADHPSIELEAHVIGATLTPPAAD